MMLIFHVLCISKLSFYTFVVSIRFVIHFPVPFFYIQIRRSLRSFVLRSFTSFVHPERVYGLQPQWGRILVAEFVRTRTISLKNMLISGNDVRSRSNNVVVSVLRLVLYRSISSVVVLCHAGSCNFLRFKKCCVQLIFLILQKQVSGLK